MVASAQLDRGNARWALERIEPVVRAHPESAEAWFTFGNALMALRTRPEDAEGAYRRALELDPDEPLHALMLGNALAAQGRHDEAAEAFERAIARAVRSLSPVIIATLRPMACSAFTAATEVGLSGSATAMIAARRPSIAA